MATVDGVLVTGILVISANGVKPPETVGPVTCAAFTPPANSPTPVAAVLAASLAAAFPTATSAPAVPAACNPVPRLDPP